MSDMDEFEGQVETDAKGLTRRGFLGAAAVAGAAAGLMAGPVGSAFASDPMTASQIAWDFETDVLVIGTGPAGCSCAAWAARGGAAVTVLEMNDKIGGKGVLAGGNLGIGGGTRMQTSAGYVETADIIYQDRTVESLRTDATMTVGDVAGGKHTVGLWRKISGAIDAEGMPRVFADKSLDTWNWLDGLGAPFLKANLSTYTLSYRGSRYYTTTAAQPVDPTNAAGMQAGGAGLIWPMHDDAVKHGAQFLLNKKMTKIIREGDRSGRVIGVEVYDSVAKTTQHYRARKAVFLGTGSWNGSMNLKTLFTPWLSKYPHISGEPYVFNDGSGVELAIEAGASLTTDRGSDWHGWHRHPGTIWHSITQPYGVPGVADPVAADVIFVNADGQRFMNEEIGEDNPAWVGGNPPFYFAQICATQKTDAHGPIVWIVMDDAQRALQSYTFTPGTDPKTANVMTDPLMYATDPTIAGLAAKIGVPAATLATTISHYNTLVTGGADTDFGKTKMTGQIATGPFHAVKWGIMKHNTIGGITINPKAQVMDWNTQVIPGLYAAGESAGGMDLIGLAKPIVFGRVAGEWAAQETTTSPAATSLTLKADHAALAHGKSVKLSSVLGGVDGIPVGASVRFEVRAPGKSAYALIKTAKVAATGAASISYKLAKKGNYAFRVVFVKTADFKASTSKSVKVVSN